MSKCNLLSLKRFRVILAAANGGGSIKNPACAVFQTVVRCFAREMAADQ
jgi:hypothetical protein